MLHLVVIPEGQSFSEGKRRVVTLEDRDVGGKVLGGEEGEETPVGMQYMRE